MLHCLKLRTSRKPLSHDWCCGMQQRIRFCGHTRTESSQYIGSSFSYWLTADVPAAERSQQLARGQVGEPQRANRSPGKPNHRPLSHAALAASPPMQHGWVLSPRSRGYANLRWCSIPRANYCHRSAANNRIGLCGDASQRRNAQQFDDTTILMRECVDCIVRRFILREKPSSHLSTLIFPMRVVVQTCLANPCIEFVLHLKEPSGLPCRSLWQPPRPLYCRKSERPCQAGEAIPFEHRKSRPRIASCCWALRLRRSSRLEL